MTSIQSVKHVRGIGRVCVVTSVAEPSKQVLVDPHQPQSGLAVHSPQLLFKAEHADARKAARTDPLNSSEWALLHSHTTDDADAFLTSQRWSAVPSSNMSELLAATWAHAGTRPSSMPKLMKESSGRSMSTRMVGTTSFLVSTGSPVAEDTWHAQKQQDQHRQQLDGRSTKRFIFCPCISSEVISQRERPQDADCVK